MVKLPWGNNSARDDLAGDVAETKQRQWGKVVDRLETNGQTKAADNVRKGGGRGDSPEELQRRVDSAAKDRKGRGRD
ncbi:hypothetical protein [Kribbella sp. NPDC003557]|uniref:hypothetical protein n=1 Tax=Kribbella sp. NPDC003557 TaxID=3154449 RepID=UPI0033B9F20F